MPVSEFDKGLLDAILLYAGQNQLTQISVRRRGSTEYVSLLCCQMLEHGKLTIVPLAQMINFTRVLEDYEFPPELGAIMAVAADNQIEVSVPGT